MHIRGPARGASTSWILSRGRVPLARGPRCPGTGTLAADGYNNKRRDEYYARGQLQYTSLPIRPIPSSKYPVYPSPKGKSSIACPRPRPSVGWRARDKGVSKAPRRCLSTEWSAGARIPRSAASRTHLGHNHVVRPTAHHLLRRPTPPLPSILPSSARAGRAGRPRSPRPGARAPTIALALGELRRGFRRGCWYGYGYGRGADEEGRRREGEEG
ncbi:hypothetical protein DAEQUDRAFT_132225 [Daedalea quercina L-15889]|uniref:Uncharacterized protein n=1 Tax=Daedalea quercina L-15889 TaxID=1314783 RepID=A0A165KQB1_9APHY|nr:hypothetical protein DAEQUDRAFT_132225 [Daedalea quercina L-15889]